MTALQLSHSMRALDDIANQLTSEQPSTSRPTSASSQVFAPAAHISIPLSSRPGTASSLSASELAHYRSVFSLFDYHSLGFIAVSDVGLVLRSLRFNPLESVVSALLNTLDHDGSGLLSFPTFVQLVTQHGAALGSSGGEAEAELLGWWRPFDMYREGRLHVREVVAVLTQYGEPLSTADVEALVGEMAVDGDGIVDLQQFVRHMQQTSSIDA